MKQSISLLLIAAFAFAAIESFAQTRRRSPQKRHTQPTDSVGTWQPPTDSTGSYPMRTDSTGTPRPYQR